MATGQIGFVSCGSTRTEQDYLNHIQATLAAEPEVSRWHFAVDNLNTHQSESLVRFVAAQSDIDEATLGLKGKSGILKSYLLSKCEIRQELQKRKKDLK